MQYDNASYDWGFTHLPARIQNSTYPAQNTWIQRQATHISLLYLKDKFHIVADRHKWLLNFSNNFFPVNRRLFYFSNIHWRISVCMNNSKGTKLHCMLSLEIKFLRWCFPLCHEVTEQNKGRWRFHQFFFK